MIHPETLSPQPLATTCDAGHTCGEHVHCYGHCASWCSVSRDFVIDSSGATVEDHGAWCFGPGATVEGRREDGERVDVSAVLVRSYHHGAYAADAFHGIPEGYRGNLVQLRTTRDRSGEYLTAAEARLLGMILQKLADKADGLDVL